MPVSTGRMPEPAAADPVVVVLDDGGAVTGTMSRATAHAAPGTLHLAVSLQVVDPDGRWLLQRRAGTKAAFAGRWANTCCTHPGPDESPGAAVIRRVREELGLVVEHLIPAGSFRYRALDESSGMVEQELDHVFVALVETDGVVCCPEEVSEVARLPFGAAWARVTSAAGAPWAAEVLRLSSEALGL